MIKKIILFFLFCLLAVSLFATYVLVDNSRVVVKEQIIEIEYLDPAFDGFTILQMSDLHSARFGRNQERLVKLLNSLSYDMIAINGDMVDRSTENPLPFLEILDNLTNKALIFYVDGNVGPVVLNRRSGRPTDYGIQLQENFCILLDKPHMLVRDNAHIWISDDFYKTTEADRWIVDIERRIRSESDPVEIAELKQALEYQVELKRILSDISDDEVLIGLTHYPHTPNRLDNPRPQDSPIYDLVLAGHYHGGQIRIPFIGAIWVPDPSPDHFFPPEEIVSGFYRGKLTQQYISRGLGSSASFPNLNFRLFNPPEVTLITLENTNEINHLGNSIFTILFCVPITGIFLLFL
ncbi:MAG: metallophosphoesterase [Anaerolineaceae bacterium]